MAIDLFIIVFLNFDFAAFYLSLQMANVCWWFFFSKVIELMDTVSEYLFFLNVGSIMLTFYLFGG